MNVLVIGAGVAGLAVARAVSRSGFDVTVAELRDGLAGSASWFAGGMLAPWCERESSEEAVVTLGRSAADWWQDSIPGEVRRGGTLVVAQRRDSAEIDRFARRTTNYVTLTGEAIGGMEPDLAGRFARGLHFPEEAHLDPRRALATLHERLRSDGVAFRFGTDGHALGGFDSVVDCSGSARLGGALRGVRGEMLILHAPEVTLTRPVRLLHPRFPLYVVPRDDHRFMAGATMIESDARGPITARSAMELLNAAYALHPAFGEATIAEIGVGIRPAYPDNLPRLERRGRTISVNGLYRHGFLLAPALAEQVARTLLETKDDR